MAPVAAMWRSLLGRRTFVESVLDTIESLVVVLDRDGEIVVFNRACEALTGYTFDEVRGRCVWDFLLLKEESEGVREVFNQLSMGNFPNTHENCWLTRDGEARNIQWFNSALPNDKGDIEFIIATGIDITVRKRAEDTVAHLAYHDSLTDLPNRALFYNRLVKELSRSLRKGHVGAVFFIDLDNFKVINDSLGHHIGDRVIQRIGQLIHSSIRVEDTAARLGGDEFVILVPEVGDSADIALKAAQNIALMLMEKITASFHIDDHRLNVTGSIGVSLFPSPGCNVDDIIKQADIAMYRAKEKGKNTFEFYDSSMQAAATERLQIEMQLRHSFRKNELELYYQPQVDASGQLIGVEALLRWNHPGMGMVPPDKFIPIAEDSGLILDIGSWVLEEACRQLGRWEAAYGARLVSRVSVNVSALQFRQADFVESVTGILDRCGVDADRVELELTESMFLYWAEESVSKISRLKNCGIRIAIDDFGTGYSSLSYLKSLPIDTLKIDRSFVHDIEKSKSDAAIVDTIISMCKHMHISSVAEGVETQSVQQYLQDRGCYAYQGYYYHRPMPADLFYATFSSGIHNQTA